MRKLSTVLSKRVVKFLQEQAKKDHKAYLSFFNEFGQFIKEGVYSDFENKHEAAKLLRFESSVGEPGELISLDEYVGRMATTQVRALPSCPAIPLMSPPPPMCGHPANDLPPICLLYTSPSPRDS